MAKLFRMCKACGNAYFISDGEQRWLKNRGLGLFRYCKDCRQERKKQQTTDETVETFKTILDTIEESITV